MKAKTIKLRGFIENFMNGNIKAIAEDAGQGTTEYAILVGVLVLIAIVAIVAFKDKVSELWTNITDGINSL